MSGHGNNCDCPHCMVYWGKVHDAPAPITPRAADPALTEGVRMGLQLMLRAYIYTNYGVLGEAKEWIRQVLDSRPSAEPQGAREVFHCAECGRLMVHATGIGPYCLNPDCDNLDGPSAPSQEGGGT